MATVTIIGNLGGDAELKNINGKSLAEFSVADKSGFGDNKQTNWFKVNIWDGLAKTNFVDYLKKGQQVMVVGELSTREYNGKIYLEIKRVYDIKLCGSSTQQSQPQQNQNTQQGYSQPKAQPSAGGGQSDLEDDLPFAPVDYRAV